MIPQAAVNEFLERELDDHLWVKQLSVKELWTAVSQLRPKPQLFEGLRKHQLACFLLGVAYPQFAFWLDLGAGKTLLALELLNYWIKSGRIRRGVVFLKSDKAFLTWEKQFKRFGIDQPYILLEGSSADKWQALEEFDSGIVFVARPGARAMLSKSVKAKGKKKSKWKIDPKLISKFAEGVGALVLDESTDDAHHTSLNHKVIKSLRNVVPIRYLLAGRPIGRDPTLLWGQFYLVDGGETLGETLGLFRDAFFTAETNYFAKNKHIKDYKFKKRMLPQLNEMIRHRSIAYAPEEFKKYLPKCVPIIEEVRFPEEAADYYKRAVQAIIDAKGKLQEVENVFLRMRQLSSGFIGYRDDDTGDRAELEFDENPKFDRLLELLEELPDDRKAVVFYEFNYSGRKIYEAVSDLSYKPIWLRGGMKDARSEQMRFENDDRSRVAVINSKLGAYSIDGLQDVANYNFFYESPVSSIDREQAERRLVRDGQRFTVWQYDLIVRGSADPKILAFHKEGADLVKSLLRDPTILAGGD